MNDNPYRNPYNQFNNNPYNPQQTPPPFGGGPRKPDTYLVWAILVTIFCCLPFGIVAIVYAAKVDSLWYGGRQQEAIEASNNAKKWSIISAVTSVAILVVYFILMAAGAISLAALENV